MNKCCPKKERLKAQIMSVRWKKLPSTLRQLLGWFRQPYPPPKNKFRRPRYLRWVPVLIFAGTLLLWGLRGRHETFRNLPKNNHQGSPNLVRQAATAPWPAWPRPPARVLVAKAPHREPTQMGCLGLLSSPEEKQDTPFHRLTCNLTGGSWTTFFV